MRTQMMMYQIYVSSIAVTSLLYSQIAIAQSQCVQIQDSAKRLACYDSANSAKPPSVGSVMDFDDFVTDKLTLRGKEVKLKIFVKQINNMTFGYRDNHGISSYIIVDITSLDRELRKRINSTCGDMVNSCPLIVSGTATGQEIPALKVKSASWD